MPTEVPEKRLEDQVHSDDKQGDRFASYKGVVINGSKREKHLEDVRKGYISKGKGKMHEEEESKWINVSE